MGNAIYQTGTINSLLEAVYVGDKTVAEVMEQGDFGLGTYDRVDGEMIVCDGICYRANADGQLSVADNAIKTPFAAVSTFQVNKTVPVNNSTLNELQVLLEQIFPTPNIAYAIKIKAMFRKIDLRSEACKTVQKTKLSELLPKIQHSFSHENISGILVGSWFPKYMSNLNVSGFHFHFVDEARKLGGHVFGCELLEGVAEIQEIHSIHMDLIHSRAFYQADLSQDHTGDLSAVEEKK